jgi:hypothetical protein
LNKQLQDVDQKLLTGAEGIVLQTDGRMILFSPWIHDYDEILS